MKPQPTVYLPDSLLKRKDLTAFTTAFLDLLKDYETPFEWLPGTLDIWSRDYMPIEVAANQFVQFRYEPDYLLKYKTYRKKLSNGAHILREIMPEAEIHFSKLVLDGGNVVINSRFAVITDKVYEENNHLRKREILKTLETELQRDVIIIPRMEHDEIGHADGMVRFVDRETMLVNHNIKRDMKFENNLVCQLACNDINVELLPYEPYGNKSWLDATGIYMNYLVAGKNLFIPSFGDEEDYLIFSNCKAHTTLLHIYGAEYNNIDVPCSDLARFGGLLHCLSWQRYYETYDTPSRLSEEAAAAPGGDSETKSKEVDFG